MAAEGRGKPGDVSDAGRTVRAYVELSRLSNIPTCLTNVLVGCAIGGAIAPRAAAVSTLTFQVPPSNTDASEVISPAVQVLARDSLGRALPGVDITMKQD